MPEINEQCVSRAWLRAIQLAKSSSNKEISNLIVNIEGISEGGVLEDATMRNVFDRVREENDDFPITAVSNTIFPLSLWRRNLPRTLLFGRYLRLWPRIKRVRENQRGTYFQRLISYPSPSAPSPFNQLEFVISAYRNGTRRRSALQCGILSPREDLNATPYQGFPCMQQVAFIPMGRNGLRVSALYPMQYLWARAYGNYLGLINLGRFMAAEMGLELRAMTCIALVAKLEKPALASRTVMERD